jgi:tetratricopeptide (TPR) repeat protein
MRSDSTALAALCVLGIAAALPALARDERAQSCDHQWDVVTSDPGKGLEPGYETLLKRWQQYGDRCSGTVVYEARLAFLYAQAGEPDKARAALKPVLGTASEFAYLVDVASLQIEMAEIRASGGPGDTKRRMAELESKYVAFVGRNPAWPHGYFLLGAIQTALDEYSKAIPTLMAGLNHLPPDQRLAPNTWSVYRHLTVCYAETGDYRDALHAGDIAYGLKEDLVDDTYFMIAAAKAYAATDDFKSAEDTLRLISLKRPEVKDDPKFLSARDFVQARKAARAQ